MHAARGAITYPIFVMPVIGLLGLGSIKVMKGREGEYYKKWRVFVSFVDPYIRGHLSITSSLQRTIQENVTSLRSRSTLDMYLPSSAIIIALLTTTALGSDLLVGQYPFDLPLPHPCEPKLTTNCLERDANAAPAQEAPAGFSIWPRFDG